MTHLNLVDLKESTIKYKVIRFPDGQQDVVIDVSSIKVTGKTPEECSYNRDNQKVMILSRMNSFLDLELIICATKALRNLGIKRIFLYTPYILGSRSDRQFSEGGTRYLKDVIAPIINAQNYESVFVIDPHSDVMENVIDRLDKNVTFDIFTFAIQDLLLKEKISKNSTIVSPDAGAKKKLYTRPAILSCGYNIVEASKHRELSTGKILSTEVPVVISNDSDRSDTYIIIDDICDGGRTFIEIAKVILDKYAEAQVGIIPRIYLLVNHGIFSAGFDELSKYFTRIYVTNSVKDISDNPLVRQLNVF